MEINNYNGNINFKAKFVKSDSLTDIVKYAVEKGKFDKLNKARKEIDKSFLRTRLRVDICYTNEYPTVVFSRFEPPKNKFSIDLDDYELTRQVEIVSSDKKN